MQVIRVQVYSRFLRRLDGFMSPQVHRSDPFLTPSSLGLMLALGRIFFANAWSSGNAGVKRKWIIPTPTRTVSNQLQSFYWILPDRFTLLLRSSVIKRLLVMNHEIHPLYHDVIDLLLVDPLQSRSGDYATWLEYKVAIRKLPGELVSESKPPPAT